MSLDDESLYTCYDRHQHFVSQQKLTGFQLDEGTADTGVLTFDIVPAQRASSVRLRSIHPLGLCEIAVLANSQNIRGDWPSFVQVKDDGTCGTYGHEPDGRVGILYSDRD